MLELGKILLGGFVGGMTVVIGVLLAEGLARTRARRERIEAWIAELGMTLPRYLIHFTGRPDYPEPSGSEFQRLSENVITALSGIRFNTRFPLRHREQIRKEVEELSARTTAVFLRFNQGIPTTSEEILNISVGALREAALGRKYDPLEDQFEEYVRSGIPTDEDDDE